MKNGVALSPGFQAFFGSWEAWGRCTYDACMVGKGIGSTVAHFSRSAVDLIPLAVSFAFTLILGIEVS